MREERRTKVIHLDELRRVEHAICPFCENVMRAALVDFTEQFLEAMRGDPNVILGTVDSFEELREIAKRAREA